MLDLPTPSKPGLAAVAVVSARRGERARGFVAGFGLALAGCSAFGGSEPANVDQRSLGEYDLARDAFQAGRHREALQHVEKALEIDSQNAEAAYLGAVVLLVFCAQDAQSSDCRFNEAEAYARKALDANPDYREAKNTLGVILVHERRYDDAIAVLRPLANDILYGSPEKSWGNLGWAYLEKGSADEAVDALQRAVAAQPLFCVGHYRLGLAYEKKGDLTAAGESLARAVGTEAPECQKMQDAYDALARVALKQGHRDDAKAHLEKCRDLASATPVGKQCAVTLGTLE
jgi:type IV pilus assembly protein PilF